MDVKNNLINLLDTIAPTYRQGSLTEEDKFPQKFITIWNMNNTENFYNNKPSGCDYYFTVCFYTNNPSEFILIDDIRNLLKNNGYICSKEIDVDSDEPTHSGLLIIVKYKELYKEV